MAMTLQHPFHDHALTRNQMSNKCTLKCDLRHTRVRGKGYCCEEYSTCEFILHEHCALVELPLQITEHPIHPEHPLEMKKRQYSCHLCKSSFDASLVIATMPSLEEEDKIQHVSHEHPLTAFHTKIPNCIRCDVCRDWIPGPAYGCHGCEFFLHESCARLPEEILQHPFHPEHPLTLGNSKEDFRCMACNRLVEGMRYRCSECDFELDFRCTVMAMQLQDQEMEDRVGTDHFFHQHPLLFGQIEKRKHTICCAVCELKISGEVYYCLGCIFFVHKLCADGLRWEMVHYLHPQHRLIYGPEPRDGDGIFWCSCCHTRTDGSGFHCESCKFSLEQECAVQTFCAVRDGAVAEIQHSGHTEHSLLLRFFSMGDESHFDCKACHKPTTGLAYSCMKCVYVLHKSCAELPLQLAHPTHPLHLLSLVPTPTKHFTCNNCQSKYRGFSFYCGECDFYLCTECATIAPTLKHQLHEHSLFYFETNLNESIVRCNSCGKTCGIDYYSCTLCNFNLHHKCSTLPPTIQHEWHPYHPLVLFDRFVEGLPEYQYCDICEELRNPDHGVYRCAREECWHTVHIGCVLPQVTSYNKPYLDELRKKIESMEETVKVMKKDLKAAKKELERLKEEERAELSKE